MATRLRLHPMLLGAAVGAALFLGVGAALPLWWVPLRPHHFSGMFHAVDTRQWGTLWEAVAGASTSLLEFPPPGQGENVVVALVLLGVGAAAGLFCWSVWACLRTPLPATWSAPAGRSHRSTGMAEPQQQPEPRPQGEERPWEEEGNVRRDCEPHRGNWLKLLGTLALLLGFVAGVFVCLGVVSIPLGIVVWRLAARDLAEMRAGRMDPNGEKETRDARKRAEVAMLTPLAGLLIWATVFLVGIVLSL
jgi:hypothetical protein